MSVVDSILQDAINSGLQMPTPVNKKQDVDIASQEKKASLPSVTAEQLAKLNGYSIAAGRMSGAGLDTASPLERDLMALSGDDLRSKYGMEVGNQLVNKRLTGLKSFVNDKTTQRDGEGVASDLVSGTGLALGNTFGGIAAFGMGAVNSEAGVRAATDLQKMNEFVQSTQSHALQNRRRANSAIDELYKRDNKAKYDEESKDSPIIASLQRFGRDFLDMAGTALSDPVTGSDVLSSTIGSILAAGPLSKGLSTIGNAVTKLAPESVSKAARGISLAAEMDRGLGVLSPARALTGMVPSAINTSIAAMEAGGAYQQTAAQIANMDLKELYDNSPDFRRMTLPVEEGGEGLTPERVRIILANRAGMMAGGIQGPLAMGTAKLTGVGKFEASPFSVPSAKGAISNLVREGFEETVQSATGQGSQNLATKRYADENKDLLDDVGGQAALGLIGGIGAAGVTQAPGFAGAAVGAAGRATGRAVLGSVDALGSVAAKRAAANKTANEATSTVADTAVRQATDEAMAQAPQAEQVMREAIDQTDSSPEVKQASNIFVDNLMSATRINPAEIEDPNVPQVVKSVFSSSTDKFDAMQKLSDVIQGTNEPTADTLSAAITLRIMQQNLEDVIMSDPVALGSLPDGHPAKQTVRQYGQLLQDMVNTPKVQRALRQAQDIIDELTASNTTKPITEEKLDTPEGQQDLQNAIGVATVAPDKADLTTNQTILTHAENGKIKLTVPQLQALMTSNAILQAAQNAVKEQEALGHKKQIDAVSQQVQINPDPKAPKLSAVAHATAVFEAMRRRNPVEAKARLQEFGKFIQHFDNKLKALNQYVTKGGAKPTYQALNPVTREWYASTWLPKIHMHDANSIELAQRMSIEAQRLVDIYNGLSIAFPDLKGGQAKVASLVQSLQGKPEDIAERTKAQKQGKTTTPAPTPTPAPKKPVVRIRADINVPAATPTVTTTTVVTDTPPTVVPTVTSTVPATTATTEASSPQENATTGAVVEVKPQGLASVYLKLVGTEPGSKINNWFLRAFKLPNEQKTRIIATETPLSIVRDALSSGEALSAFTGSEGALAMPSELSKAYRSYIKTGDGIIAVLENRLKAYMAKTSASGDDAGKTMLSSFLSGSKPTNEYRTGKMLNITEQVGDNIQYNQELLEAAVLAGLQWRLSSHQSETPMNEDDAASIMNISKDDVDQNLLDVLEQGLTAVTAKRTLANKIRQFWGLDSVSDAPDGYVQGIAESMAAELLEAMIQTGAIRHIQLTFRGTPEGTQIAVEGSKKDKVITVSNQYVVEGGKHNVDFYTSNDITDTQALVELAPTLIEKVVLVTPDDVQFIGDARPPVAKTQLRNPVVDNTPDQIAMIKAEQKTSHYINQPMVDLYQALGLDKILQLFGSGDLDGRPLNQNHKLGLEGKNRTITGAFNHLMSVVNEVKLSAGDAAIDQVPIRYAYNINKVGRLQMLGRYNPQSTKLIREAILPTRSTLNLSSENSKEYGKFMLAVAQAIGQKVHKQSLNTSIDATMKELNGSLAPVVQMLKDFHTTGKMDAGFVEAIKNGLGSNLTTVALNALSEYARLQITEDRSSFTTPLYVEADGVTNGPINAMALLSIGNFTPDWVNRMRKGGLSFFGPKTMNDIHTTAGPGGDQSDMYQTTTDVMKGLFVKMSQEMKDPRAKAQMNHLVQMLDLFLPDFEIKDNQLVMKRGIAKNPLTITIYGSGAKGIAGKITDAVLEQLYERLSEVMERQGANPELSMAEAMFGHKATDKESAEQMMERFTSAYEALTTNQIAKGKNGYFIVKGDKTFSLTAMNKPEFTLDKGRVNNLKANMRKLFVDPMREAIETTVGKPLMDAASLVQKATQIQSVFQQVMFNQAVNDLIKEKLKTNPKAKSEGLSRVEQDAILRQVLKQFPLIQTGKQSFFIAGSQSTDVDATRYGTSTTDTFRTPGFVYGPTDASVAGIPTMVIGSGDGMMMQILSIMKNSPTRSLKIFDGVNFPLDKLEASSKAANQAVYESWQGNPLQAVYEMFAASKFDVSQMPTTVLKDLARTLGVKESTVGDIQQGLNALRYTLEQAALSAEARHNVMRKVAHSIDQMASAGVPYEHFGIVLKGNTDEDIARELDRLYVIELAQLMKDAKERKPEDSSNNSAATTASAKSNLNNNIKVTSSNVPTKAQSDLTDDDSFWGSLDTSSNNTASSDDGFPPTALIPVPAGEEINLSAEVLDARFRKLRSLWNPKPEISKLTTEEGEEYTRLTQEVIRRKTGAKVVTPLAGATDQEGELKIYHPTSLAQLMKDLKLSPTIQKVFNNIAGSKGLQKTTVVYGPRYNLSMYARVLKSGNNIGRMINNKQINGLYSPDNDTIFIMNNSNETLIHELIHAATFKTVLAHYNGTSTPDVKAAIGRIEELMKQFLELDDDLSDSYNDVRSEILNAKELDNPAKALNEFMAWTLANKHLAEKLNVTTATPLGRLIASAIAAIKKLIFGDAKAPEAATDMFSNLLFNTAIIANADSQNNLQEDLAKTTLFHSPGFGQNERLISIQQTFNQVIGKHLTSNPRDLPLNESKVQIAIKNAVIIADNVIARGIPMSPQERSTFHTIVAAMATEATIDPHSMAMAQTLYVHVAGSLNVQDKFGILANGGVDAQGRSSILPVFLALAMVNDDFRQLLATMPLPKSVLQGWNTLDGVLTNAGTIAMDSLASRLSGTNKTTNIQDAIDALSNQIRKTTTDRAGLVDMLSNTSSGAVDWVNDKVIQGVEALAGAVTQGAEKLEAGAPSKLTATLAAAARITEKLVNERDADLVSEGIMSKINRIKGFSPFRDLITDLVGRTMNNKAVYDLIKAIRSHVQQDRQNYRDEVPKIIAEKFNRRLKDTEWNTLFRGLGKTDLAALRAQYSVSEILGFISDPILMKKTIGELQSQLKKVDAAHFNKVDQKAKQLATYMMTGKPGTKLLRNADAISHLLFERTQKGRVAPDAAYVSQVDQLVTLYALEMLNQTDMKSLVSLVQSERQGMEFSLSYLVGQRAEETRKSVNGRARFNSYKGYIPSLQQEGVSLLVANDTDHADMLSKSYVRVGAYSGSDAEGIVGRKSYYFAPVSAMATFNQGIMQNVRQTAGGVETTTGFTEGMTAGRITDKSAVDRITKRIMLEGSNTTENLMPVYDNAGVVVAYERSIDPAQMVKLNHDTNLAKMIGVWRGRQVEEGKAQEFNETLVDALHTMWINEKSAKRGEYVNLWDPKTLADDPVLNDALALMNAETRAYVEDKFGDEFWVRRDMLNDAFGYRNASMGDAWTGNTRWNETFQENFKNLAITVMGNRAYKTLVNGEKFLQKTVATAKTLIVVKSVVVTAGNLLSNMYQLVANGISPVVIAKAAPKKLAEVQAYMTSRKKEVRLEADLRAAEGNTIRERKLNAELTTIRDSYKRMSIWPLIKAGELSAISHDVSQNDMLLNGKFEEYFEQLVDKLPGPLQTAGRYALITKDTALFQGLSKSIEYGDFIAKAILYDHLTMKKGRTSEEALGHITEEFVNYDRLPGRFRGYVEGIGMLWFWSFKIRSVKVALRMIRSNPVRALLTEVLPHPGGFKTGSPISDNLIGKLMDGTLGYSVGPGMGFRAPMLNPWSNLAF